MRHIAAQAAVTLKALGLRFDEIAVHRHTLPGDATHFTDLFKGSPDPLSSSTRWFTH